jgi:hypothetical protein
MNEARKYDPSELLDEKPKGSGPVLQEKQKGHEIMPLGGNVYAEVSLFKGKTYVGIRKWFQAENGNWYRTKNGLQIDSIEMLGLLTQATKLMAFIQKEEENPWREEK